MVAPQGLILSLPSRAHDKYMAIKSLKRYVTDLRRSTNGLATALRQRRFRMSSPTQLDSGPAQGARMAAEAGRNPAPAAQAARSEKRNMSVAPEPFRGPDLPPTSRQFIVVAATQEVAQSVAGRRREELPVGQEDIWSTAKVTG